MDLEGKKLSRPRFESVVSNKAQVYFHQYSFPSRRETAHATVSPSTNERNSFSSDLEVAEMQRCVKVTAGNRPRDLPPPAPRFPSYAKSMTASCWAGIMICRYNCVAGSAVCRVPGWVHFWIESVRLGVMSLAWRDSEKDEPRARVWLSLKWLKYVR